MCGDVCHRVRAVRVVLERVRDGVGVEMPARGVPLEIGRARVMREGSRAAILSLGTRLAEALAAQSVARPRTRRDRSVFMGR